MFLIMRLIKKGQSSTSSNINQCFFSTRGHLSFAKFDKVGTVSLSKASFVKWRQISLVQIHFLLDIKSDVTLLIMFLKKSSEMLFRRKPSISVALHAQKLCCKINKSKSRAKASRKPLKESFQNIFSKVTERTKRQKQNTEEKDIKENSRIKSIQ